MRGSVNPYAAATAGDANRGDERRVNGDWVSFSAMAAAAVLSQVTSSLPSSRSFRPTPCEVWNGSARVDVERLAASNGLVGMPCFRRRRCSINGTAGGDAIDGGELQTG